MPTEEVRGEGGLGEGCNWLGIVYDLESRSLPEGVRLGPILLGSLACGPLEL